MLLPTPMTKLRGDDELFALLDVMGGKNVQMNQEQVTVVEEDQSNADGDNHRCSSLYFRMLTHSTVLPLHQLKVLHTRLIFFGG